MSVSLSSGSCGNCVGLFAGIFGAGVIIMWEMFGNSLGNVWGKDVRVDMSWVCSGESSRGEIFTEEFNGEIVRAPCTDPHGGLQISTYSGYDLHNSGKHTDTHIQTASF